MNYSKVRMNKIDCLELWKSEIEERTKRLMIKLHSV